MVKTISQRDLRNDNAEIMRGVEDGETYTVTRRGVPVARIEPLRGESGLRCDRPARTRPTFSSMVRVRVATSAEEALTELRGER